MQRHSYDQQFINKAVDQWRPRLQAVIRAHGGHRTAVYLTVCQFLVTV